jgi:hypothetical protein
MSYEISLYRRDFLDRAIREQLGDWTNAGSLSEVSRELAKAFLQQRGYTEQNYPWQSNCQTYQHPEFKEQVEVTIFNGCISFAIQYSERANEAVTLSIESAKELGSLIDLAVYDPQDARIIKNDR